MAGQLWDLHLVPPRRRGELWTVAHDWRVRLSDGRVVCIKAGFQTNLGSVPRLLWRIWPPSSFPAAYVLHDWLCGNPQVMTREEADKELVIWLGLEGAGWFDKAGHYAGVRLGALAGVGR